MAKTFLKISGFSLIFSSIFFLDISSALASTPVSGSISGDVVWSQAGGTYIANNVTIPAGASLTIEPGTIVKVPRQAYAITLAGGTLTIGAPDAAMVYITSVEDDSVGGDENEVPSTGTAGDWYALRMTSGTANIYRTHIRYGGYNSSYGQIINNGAELVIAQSDLSDTFTNIVSNGGTTDVHDCTIGNSRYFGIRQNTGTLRFARNTFTGVMSAAMYSMGGEFQDGGGNTSESASIGISGSRSTGHSVIAKGLVYLLNGFGVAGDASLDVLPGSIIKTTGVPMSVGGTVSIGAWDGEEVTITSSKDDIGGDTNGNGAATSPAPGDWQGIVVSTNGNLTIRNTRIRYGGISQYGQIDIRGGTATLSRVYLSDSLSRNIYQIGGVLNMADSDMRGAQYGLVFREGSASIHTSSIHDISEFGIWNLTSTVVDASHNWWGDASGPWHATHPEGLGTKLEGNINFAPWKGCYGATCHSSVLFLPGLEASRLYADGVLGTEDQLWEPNNESDAEQLFLDEQGKSRNPDIYTRDVIDEKNVLPVGQGNIYKSFLLDLASWKSSGFISDYAAIPYDWRLSFGDILNGGGKDGKNISYTNPNGEKYIISELRRLAAESDTKKVTIVAHSNGGLLAKALVKELGEDEAKVLIDNLVLVAVPQSGTPQAIGALLHGYDQGLPFDWLSAILSVKTARELAENMSGAYPLLPSNNYFRNRDSSDRPVITFEDGAKTASFISEYGYKIDTVGELYRFLRDTNGKVSADSEDVYSPANINPDMLSYGEGIHSDLDDTWSLPNGIKVYQIAGIGEDTLESIQYKTGKTCTMRLQTMCLLTSDIVMYSPEVALDGDGTVKTSSALAMSDAAVGVKKFWVNLEGYNKDVFINRDHADILEVDQLRNFIKDNILARSFTSLPDYVTDFEPSISQEKYFKILLHSPLALSIKDSEGHEVSASKSDITGARYKRFGEVQYISVPASTHPTVVLDGEAEGSFTLEVKEVSGDVVVAETTFAAIPNTVDTQVTMDFPDGTLEHAEPLVINYDGQGEAELSLEPKIGEVVTTEQSDAVAPTTVASLSGTQGSKSWYTSDVVVTLTATDNESGSGIDKTEYSLDNGTIWNAYTNPVPISTEGMTTLQYRSIDKAGNTETAKIETIKIDKTAPEAKISFNKDTQKLEITGRDNLSTVSVITINKPEMNPSNKKVKKIKAWFSKWHGQHKKNLPDSLTTLTDEAGHTTSLTFEKTQDRNGFSFVRLLSLGYDGNETGIDAATLQYQWKVDRKGKYQLFSSRLKASDNSLESHYIPKQNETWIMEKSEALTDDDQDEENEGDERDEREEENNEGRPIRTKLSGMVILYLESNKGTVETKY